MQTEPKNNDSAVSTMRLVSPREALIEIFPMEASRPSFRSWQEWAAKGLIPRIKLGARVFMDPEAVRKAILENAKKEGGSK